MKATSHRKLLALFGVLVAFAAGEARADEAALKAQIDALQQQLNSLQAQISTLQAQTAKTEPHASAPADASAPVPTTGSLSTQVADTTVGGYGEIIYNHYRKDRSRNQADLRRFVLSFSHRFSDRLSLNSELEVEHAVTSADDEGEVALEQAYLNYNLTSGINLKAGLFLMPFGFLNQAHEPPVFYGVERNEVETRIIPSTWREGGIGLFGSTEGGFSWDIGLTTGFDVSKFDKPGKPLGGVHQELQLAKGHDLAVYAALNYRGVPGLTIGGAAFRGNSTQGNATFKTDSAQPDLSGIDAPVTLWDLHARWQAGGLDLQTVYAQGSFGDAGRLDQILQTFNTANSADRPFVPARFYGWLVQGAYTVWQQGDHSVTPFARYERFNTQSRMPAGFSANPANADNVTTLGLSFKPHAQVVFKADYQWFQDNSLNDRFNLGLGYMF